MTFRQILLGVGCLFMMAGIGLIFVWLGAVKTPPVDSPQPEQTVAEVKPSLLKVLTAAHSIPARKLLRKGDFQWKEVEPSEVKPGNIVQGQASETEFLGAISRRDFAEGEPIISMEFVKPGDEKFFTSVLKPGTRAITIFVDAAQVSSGLVSPGDQVDVLLTQTFNDDIADNNIMKLHYKNVVGETVLHNVRVIALDQTLYKPTVAGIPPSGPASDPRLPKTVTLELFGKQPESLMVASEMGKLQLAVLPDNTELTHIDDKRGGLPINREGFEKIILEPTPRQLSQAGLIGYDDILSRGVSKISNSNLPVWSSGVSPALDELIALASLPPPPAPPTVSSTTGSTLENLIRRPVAPSRENLIAAPSPSIPKSGSRSPYYVERRP